MAVVKFQPEDKPGVIPHRPLYLILYQALRPRDISLPGRRGGVMASSLYGGGEAQPERGVQKPSVGKGNTAGRCREPPEPGS